MKKNLLFILILISSIIVYGEQVDFVWGKQFGSEGDERTRNLIIDSLNNVYVFGKTKGKVGKEYFGKYDGFIVKIDSSANTIWAIQVGSKEEDDLFNATTDDSGNLYVTGYIGIDAEGKSNIDILVVKINSNGEIVWQKQYGTDSVDIGANIAVSTRGDIYVIGSTKGSMGNTSCGKTDCFILHLDNEGNQLNVLQFGTSADEQGYGITIGTDSNIYVCGTTEGNLAAENAGNSDIFWGIYSKDLKLKKIKQVGTEKYDCADEIETDSKHNIYIAGSTDWVLALALKQMMHGDCFLQKWNNKGEMNWEEQFGTDNWDGINGLAVIPDKGVVVSGCQNNPMCQSFCRMYNGDGSLLWTRNIVGQGGRGTCGKGVCVDRQGYIYHTGYTGANLFSELRGGHDAFLIRLKADIK